MEIPILEQAYYIGELVGLIIVVLSLVYVGRQLSQTNRANRIAAIQQNADTFRQNMATLAEHSETWINGVQSFSDLRPAERAEFSMLMSLPIRHLEQSYFLFKEGVLYKQIYMANQNLCRDLMAYAGARDWWQTRRSYFDEDFRDTFEAEIEQLEGTPELYKFE